MRHVEVNYEPPRDDRWATFTSTHWRGGEVEITVFQASGPVEAQEIHDELGWDSDQGILQDGDCSERFDRDLYDSYA